MNYDSGYKNAIETIIGMMHSEKHSHYSVENVSILEPLYLSIVEGISFSKRQFEADRVKMIIKKGRRIHLPSKSRYMCSDIHAHIIKNVKYQVEYKTTFCSRNLIVRFSLFDNKLEFSELEYYFQMILSWIYTIFHYSETSCGKTQIIDLYFTDFKKLFPKSSVNVLGNSNCNSGYSSISAETNEIVIYRSEEWFKVLIHETFHSFGLEPNFNCERQLNKYIGTLLPIQQSVRVNEAYIETWARIINVVYSAVINSDSRNEFYNILRFSLQLEVLFSIYQAVKVLDFMNLDYESVIDKRSVQAKIMYKENTHVFAYYILTASFMNNIFGFIRWCTKHNTKWLQFYKSNRTCKSFERLIKDSLYNIEMKKACKKFKNHDWQKEGLRFSIVDSVN